jgi:exosortase D (VPLPA-CTERM-specific)
MALTDTLRPVSGHAGLFWLSLAIIAAALFFSEALIALGAAWTLAEYSHGPLIPVLSGLMMLRQMRSHPPSTGPVTDRWPGLLTLFGALSLGALGKAAGIPDIVAYALIVWIGGMVLVSFGWREGLRYWPPVLHLVFMLPLPGLLYYKISTNLQFISSELGVVFVRLFGVEGSLDGNVITVAGHQLLVAEACSGLRYLFPILSFSYLFAVLYRGPLWHKAVLLLSAAPITIFMNSLRIGMIGVMVEHVGIDYAEGLSHLMEGWVVFIACVLILFLLAAVMLRFQANRMTLAQALDLDTSGLGEQFLRLGRVQPSAALIASVLAFGGAGLLWSAWPRSEPAPIVRESLLFFPFEFDDWRAGDPQRLDAAVATSLGADDYRLVTYRAPQTAAPVELFIAWYADQSQGGVHSPEVCLPGAGWEMVSIERRDLSPEDFDGRAFPVNRAVIQRDLDRMLVYYWFEQYGGRSAWDFAAKAALVSQGLRHRRTDGALIRLVTPLGAGEDPADADARILSLIRGIIEPLPRFVPNAAAP